ncbi:MAG: FeoB-associated Cys-rich membrane protein [Solobacterium sp.]|nr:FeoB-associated Cys-rich membrane protein [Solobacterium sp.]
MNPGTVIVILILVVIVALDIRYLMKKGIQGCGHDCSQCGSKCRFAEDLKQARADLAKDHKDQL